MTRVEPALWAVPPTVPEDTGGATGHVFLLGFPRSGTTLLEVALDGHPRVASLEEHELLSAGVLGYMREPVDFAPLLQAGQRSSESCASATGVRCARPDWRWPARCSWISIRCIR